MNGNITEIFRSRDGHIFPWMGRYVGRPSSCTTDITENDIMGYTKYGCKSANYNFGDEPQEGPKDPEDLVEYLDPKLYPELYI